MTSKKLPLYLENTFQSLYGNFGNRLLALILDGLILFPATIGMLVFNSLQLNYYYFTFVVFQAVILAYSIYLPVRFGATPGKRIMGLTILKIDGLPIGYREAFLKALPVFSLAVFSFVLHCYLISQADAATYNNTSWIKQNNYLQSFAPYLFYLQMALIYGFYFANLIVFLMNDRKRSIGDQLAGTVVVYTRFIDKIKVWNSEETIK
jgi:uncharacterized RDD family membrane protein YckC